MRSIVKAARAIRPQVSSLHTSRVAFSHGIVQHRTTDYNNENTPFEFTAESTKQIEAICSRFPTNYRQSAVIPVLYIAQEQEGANNWLPLNAMNKVAEVLDMPPMKVYEVASFYTMFNREPVGKYHIQLCGTSTCMTKGAPEIKEAIMKHCNIKDGETSADGLITLTEVECLGACVNAPMIQVNNKEFYEYLTPENMIEIIEGWKAGKTPKEGNQNHCKTCEGPMGKTSLFAEPVPVCRDLDALKAELEKPDEEEV